MSEAQKAAGYIRVSKDKSKGGTKGEKIISPTQQIAAIRKLCAERGWELWGFRDDIDKSGFKMSYTKRPGLMELLEAAKRGEFQIACVYRMDRSARRTWDQGDIVRLFAQYGVDVYSATEPFDPHTATGRFQRNIMAPISEYFSEILSQNIQDARLSMVGMGRAPGGLPPYGYMWREKNLVPDPTTAPIVQGMFNVALQVGTNNTVRRVWEYLEAQGARAPLSGYNWHPDSIRYILRNSIYTGRLRYNEEMYELNIERLVTDELWNGVQAFMQEGKGHNTARKNLLVGFIYCGYEGHKNEGWSPTVQYLYEFYSNHQQVRRYKCRVAHRYLNAQSKCDHPMLAADGFEKAFVSVLVKWLKAQANRNLEVETIRAQEIGDTREALQGLGGKLKIISDAISSLFDDYHKFRVVTRDQFAERNRIYLREQEELKVEYGALEHRLSLLVQDPENDMRVVVALEDAWDSLTLDERRNFIATVVRRLVVHKDRVTVETYGDPFDLWPTMVYRNVMYFHGEEPKQNLGNFKKGFDPRRVNPQK